jgi:peptidyl-prolyl cis-trans isomerase C
MNFSRIRPVINVIIILTWIGVSVFAFAADKTASENKAAVVNGVVISQEEFDRELDFFIRRAAPGGQPIPDVQMARMKNEVLDSLIDRELLFQESRKKGIQINSETVADQLKNIQQKYPNKDEFTNQLNEMGLSESDVKAQIERGLAIQELIDREIVEKIQISDEESKLFYDNNPQFFEQPEQVKASHILIKVETGASDAQKAEARKKIESIQQKAQKGEDFADLAKTYSEGPSGPNGGDLGYFRRGQMVKPFEDAAFALKINETSDIVETRFGYHLIMVVDKKPATKMTYAEVKDRLNDHLKKQKTNSEANTYIDNLRKDAKIEKFL